MKKTAAALLLVLVSGLALAAGTARSWTEGQSLTRAAPTLSTEGMSLATVTGFYVTVCAELGQTVTGGTLRAWMRNEATGLWGRNPDLDLTIGAPGTRCRPFPNQRVTVPSGGRVLYATSAVTVSAGTTATVRIDAWSEQRP